MLERLQLPFRAIAPDIDERPFPQELPTALVERLAVAKARAIAQQHPEALVIGSDQVAVQDGRIVGKPADHAAAVQQLRDASGRRVVLHTGLALIDAASGRTQSQVVPFATMFRRLSDAEIESYLAKDKPYNCAASALSGRGWSLASGAGLAHCGRCKVAWPHVDRKNRVTSLRIKAPGARVIP